MHPRFSGRYKGRMYWNGKCIGYLKDLPSRLHRYGKRKAAKVVFLEEAAEIDKRVWDHLLNKSHRYPLWTAERRDTMCNIWAKLEADALAEAAKKKETLKVNTLEFRLPTKRLPVHLNGPKEQALIKAFTEAFGVSVYSLTERIKRFPYGHIKITCTYEQFARFIVLRDRYGAENWIAELQPEFTDEKGLKISGLWNVVPETDAVYGSADCEAEGRTKYGQANWNWHGMDPHYTIAEWRNMDELVMQQWHARQADAMLGISPEHGTAAIVRRWRAFGKEFRIEVNGVPHRAIFLSCDTLKVWRRFGTSSGGKWVKYARWSDPNLDWATARSI